MHCETDFFTALKPKVVEMAMNGLTETMPSVNSGKVGHVKFSDLKTCNGVDEAALQLADRL
jgi:hypothetical protein